MLKPLLAAWMLALTVILGANAVSGQDYPNRPIRIVTANVGGGSDFAARLIAQGFPARWASP
jgi:tripartite-type tricarboxylate transporter receptor subunit TctC